MKKTTILILSLLLIAALAACGAEKKPDAQPESEPQSVEEETSAVNRDAETRPDGEKDPDITTVATRATSPDHLSTITDATAAKPKTTAKKESAKTTKAEKKTEKKTEQKPETTTKAPVTEKKPHVTTTIPVPEGFKEPEVDYGGAIEFTARGKTEKIEIVSHTFSKNDRGINVNLQVKTLSASGENKSALISYDLFDADGKRLNEKPMTAVVIISEDPEKTTPCLALATEDTAKVVFFAHETA